MSLIGEIQNIISIIEMNAYKCKQIRINPKLYNDLISYQPYQPYENLYGVPYKVDNKEKGVRFLF